MRIARLLLLVCLAAPQVCPAQSGRYTFAFVGLPLSQALDRVIDATDISLAYETRLVAGRTSFCKVENADAASLLSCVLKGTELDFVRLSSGTYVIVNDSHVRTLTGGLVGQVVDAETGSPLSGANVVLADAGTATNPNGRFALTGLLPGPHRLSVSHVAYHGTSDSVWVVSSEARQVSIELEPRVILSAPVVVSAIESRVGRPGEDRRTAKDLERVGSLDVVQSLSTVAGVRMGEAVADLHVQGGAADEQQFLLDGVPVFVPVPTGGFISPFSPFALEQVTIRKAGFGVSHGSHLSGVIEIDHHLGAERPQELSLHIDPISANGRWDGRHRFASGAEATWMAAARKALWDTYHPPQLESLFKSWSRPDPFLLEARKPDRPVRTEQFASEPGELEVGFTDLHLAGRVRFSGLRSLRVAFYRGANSFGSEQVFGDASSEPFELEDAYRWQNRALDARYEWVQSGRLLLNANVWLSDYTLRHPIAGVAETEEFNALREAGVRVGGDVALSARHSISTAVEVAHSESEFLISLDPSGSSPAGTDELRPISWRMSAFVEDRLGITPSTTLEMGLRTTYVPARQTVYGEPRLAVRYDLETDHGVWSARGAAGIYRQFVHSFDVATHTVVSLLPRVRFWLPVSEREHPPAAYHIAASLLYRPHRIWEFGLETYYKHQPHLLVLNYGAPRSNELLARAKGRAYGAAATMARRGDRLQIEAQYEFALASRRVPNRFDGRDVAVPWSAPHQIVLEVDAVPVASITLTLRGHAAFGRMWGFRQAYYDFLATDPASQVFGSFDLTRPEDHRLPAFVRLDVGAAYSRRMAGVSIQGRIFLINALGRRNVSDWSLRYDEAVNAYVRESRRGAPFMPVLSLGVNI